MQRDDRSRDPEGSGSRRRWYESRDRDLTPRAGDQGDSHSRSYSRQQQQTPQQPPQPQSPYTPTMYQSPTQQRQYDPQRYDQYQMYQQSPQQYPPLPPRQQQYPYQYQQQYQQQQPQQQSPYYNAPPQSMPSHNSPYQQQQQQNPQRPQTPSSVFSSSSDTSTSLLDISRFKDTKQYGGVFGTFFKAPSDRVKQRLHRKKSKKRRVLYFGNSSSSSVNSDLAYGNGYVRQPKSRTLSPRSQSRTSGQGYAPAAAGPGPSQGRRRSSGGSDRAARLTPKKKKTADEEIMALGQQLSNLARRSKEDEERQARKASGKGKGKAAAMGLAAGAAGAAMASQYGKNGRGANNLKQRVESSDDEDDWEDASDDEDGDDSSSSDGAGSGGDSELAYGTVAESSKPAFGGAAAAAGGAAAAAYMADHRRQSSYGYDSSPEYRRHGDRGSIVDPRLFGPHNSLRGSINTPCGFRDENEAAAYRRDSANFGNGGPIQMQDTYSGSNRYDGDRFSTPIAQQDPAVRPPPVPLQQPVPKVPVSSKVYDAEKVDDANRRDQRQRRSEQTEEKGWGGAAAGGIAAAAAAAGVAMASSSKKEGRERRDEQQRDRDDRELQQRLEKERQRALELEEQKLRELERQKARAQQRVQHPETEAERHERLEKERARNMKWEREYREMEPEAVIPNYNNERKSSRYNDHDDTPKDRKEKEKSNVDVVVAPKRDQNEGKPFGIQYGSEFQLEREPTVKSQPSERKPTQNGRDLPLATGAGHQAVTESTKSTYQDIDPFQYQVSDDAFTMSHPTTPGRPLTPNVVTIEREPNFDDSPPRDLSADARLSRRDSFEIQRMVEDYHRESQGASQRRDPRNGHEYEEEEHKARSILDEAKHATIPVAAAAVASAVAVENERSQERRKSRYSDDSSQDTSRSRKDAVQEEADRYYRETNIARKIASDEMRSRSASPERSVVDKWQDSKEESFTIVTPPSMDDKHPDKSIYEGPDADVKIDNKIHPREEHHYRNVGNKSSRRNVSRERPLLNLIYPTPAVSRQHTPAPEAREAPEATVVDVKPEDYSIGPKGEIVPVNEPAAKSVSWGENETKRFDADSPEKSDSDNYFPAEKAVEKSRPKLNKASRWGILAAALAGSSAEPQNEPDVEVDPKQVEMPGAYSYSDAGSSDVSIRRAEFYVDDMNSFPPVVGTKPEGPQQMPGRFADDFEFAATLAAGLKDTGFNPDIVIDDPTYSRRDSPPGVQEANGDSHSGPNGNAWYKRPYAEAVPDPVDVPKLLPEKGFVLGEVETPQEKTIVPFEGERDFKPDAPKPEDVPLPDNQSDSPKLSKREQRKRDKSDVVVVQDDGKIESVRAEPSLSRDVGEPVWEGIASKRSKKDRKSRDVDDESSPRAPAPATYESRSDYDWTTPRDEGRSHSRSRSSDISYADIAKAAVPALALGAIASSSRDTPSRDVRDDTHDSPKEPRQQSNDDYYYGDDRSRVSSSAKPSHHRHSSRDVSSRDVRSDDEQDSSKQSRKHKKDRESRDEGKYRESSTLDPNDRRSSRRESSRDRSRDRSRSHKSRDHSRDHKSRDRSRDRSRDHRSKDHRSRDRSRDRTRDRSKDRTREKSRDRSRHRRSDDEEEKSKRSKRHPYGYDSPSMAASEISVASSSSKRSKKSKRRNGDDYDDSRDSPRKRDREREYFDDKDVSSVVSESRGHRRTSSRYEDDDVKSSVSSPGSSRREKEYKERKTPEKRPSNSVLSGLFKSSKDKKKDSFLGNADTLGAGVGLASAAAIYASDAARSNAADAPSDQERSASGDGLRHARSFELVDPEVLPRVIKPAIDPQYGDLLPLPPSEPSSPTSSHSDELPPLPDSRPDTPPEERGVRRDARPLQRRRSVFETPVKSPSRTAVPIALRLGNRSSNPASPVSFRASPASSPIIPHSDATVMSRRQARPTSWDNSREFMPLYLLEHSRHPPPTTGSVLPALPPSEPSETSARNSPESEFLKHNDGYFGESLDYTGPDLRVDTVLSEQHGKESDAESQQTTPRAEFMPVLPEPTPSVTSNEPSPNLSRPSLPEPTPSIAPDPPTPSLATPMESRDRDAADDKSSRPPFDAAAIAVPVGLGASAGLAAAALAQPRGRTDSPTERTDDLTSADEHFSDAVEGPSEQTSPREDMSRSLETALDRDPTPEPIARSPYEPTSETTTGAFTTPVNELVSDEHADVKSDAEVAAEKAIVKDAEDQAARDITDAAEPATEPFNFPANNRIVEESTDAKFDIEPAAEPVKKVEESAMKDLPEVVESANEARAIFVDEPATQEPTNTRSDTELSAEKSVVRQAEEQVAKDIADDGETAKESISMPVKEPVLEEPIAEAPTAVEPTVNESSHAERGIDHATEESNETAEETANESRGISTNEPVAEEPTDVKSGTEPAIDEAAAKEIEEQAAKDAAAAFQAAEAEAAAQAAAEAETAAQAAFDAEAEEAAKEEEEMAVLKSKKAKKLTKTEKARLMTLIGNSVKRAQEKAAETTPEPVTETTEEPSVKEPAPEEPVAEERNQTRETTWEDRAATPKEPAFEPLENIREAEPTEHTVEPTPVEMVTEEASRDLAAEPIVEDITANAPESSSLLTEESLAEPSIDAVPEIVEPSDMRETEVVDKDIDIIEVPGSTDKLDTTPQPELIVEDVTVPEPSVEPPAESKTETAEDLPREIDTSTALTPDAVVESQSAPSVDAPIESAAEATEAAEVKSEEPVAQRAENEITTEEWDNMNAKDRKNMKKKLKKKGLEPIIQDSFDIPAPAEESSKDEQPAPSEQPAAKDEVSESQPATIEPEVPAQSVSEPIPDSSTEPSSITEVVDIQEPIVSREQESVSMKPEQPSEPVQDNMSVDKEVPVEQESQDIVHEPESSKEVEASAEPAAATPENEPVPDPSTEVPTVVEPAPDAAVEEKAVEELTESPSKSKKKKKKNKSQQQPTEEPAVIEPIAAPVEDTTTESAPAPEAEKDAFDAWADPVLPIETPVDAPADTAAEPSSATAEDSSKLVTELPLDAPTERSVDADAFDAWAQPDATANVDAPEQESDKPVENPEQTPEASNDPAQGEDAVSSKSKKKKKKKKGTKTDDEPVTETQDNAPQDKSLEAPEKPTNDSIEPSATTGEAKTEPVDAPTDQATPSQPNVPTPNDGDDQLVETVKTPHIDTPVVATPARDTRDLDDLDDVPYSPSSENLSPSERNVRKDRQGYFPSALRALPGAAGISAFKRMWGFQDQYRAQNRTREAQPEVEKPSDEIQPDTVNAEKSEVVDKKPEVPVTETEHVKADEKPPLTADESHISEPLFSQGDAPVDESQGPGLESSQVDELQTTDKDVSHDVPTAEEVPTAVEQPATKTEGDPTRPAETAPETAKEAPVEATESVDVNSTEEPSTKTTSDDTTHPIDVKPDDTTEDKSAEMTEGNDIKPAETAQDDSAKLPEVGSKPSTEEGLNKTIEVDSKNATEETAVDNAEADVPDSKKKVKKNKKKKKSQANQDDTPQEDAKDSTQQDQSTQEGPVQEATPAPNEVDVVAPIQESVAETSRGNTEELGDQEPEAESDNKTQAVSETNVEEALEVKPEIDEKPVESELLDQPPTDKQIEPETKEEVKNEEEHTRESNEEPLVKGKPDETPDAKPEGSSEDKLESGNMLPGPEASEQPQTDDKLAKPEGQEIPAETNDDAAQVEDKPTESEAQPLPEIDVTPPQPEERELQQTDATPLESITQETMQSDDKPAENEIKEPEADARSPEVETPKEEDTPLQPEVAEQMQTDDKPAQAEGTGDFPVDSEAKQLPSIEEEASKAVPEESTQASQDPPTVPSIEESLSSATPELDSTAKEAKEAEDRALREADDAEAAKEKEEIDSLLEKQSRRGGRLLKKDQKRLTALEESASRRAEAQTARDAEEQAAEEQPPSTTADTTTQESSEADAKPAQPEETRDIDVSQDKTEVGEALASEKQPDISETKPAETSGEAGTPGTALLDESAEKSTDVPPEEKPTENQNNTDTAPTAERQEETTIDNEATELASSKKSKKKKKRKSVSFSENGESQDPATENTEKGTQATEPEQPDQTPGNTEEASSTQAEPAPQDTPATQDGSATPASEDTPADLTTPDVKEAETSTSHNLEDPSAENTTAEGQGEGPSDAVLDQAESEPASEKKSKKKKKKKKNTSIDESEKQPEADSLTQENPESTAKSSDDVKDAAEQEESSIAPTPVEQTGVESEKAPLSGDDAALPQELATADAAAETTPANDEQSQSADVEKPAEISPAQEPASTVEAANLPTEQPPNEEPLPTVDEPDSPAKLSKKDKKKKKKADKKKAALEEESKEPEPEQAASSEKGEVKVEPESTERPAEDSKDTRDETSKQTDSTETPNVETILEGEPATPANDADEQDTGKTGELPSEEPASPEDERGGFSLSQSQTDQKNKAKDNDFEILQDPKTNHPTQPEPTADPEKQEAAVAAVDEAQSQGSSEGTQRKGDKTVAVHPDAPVEPKAKSESGLGLGEEKLEDEEEYAGLSKKQIKKLKKARALAAQESSAEPEMPKETATSTEEASEPAAEIGAESESNPQTCVESAAEAWTRADQERGYETMNEPLPDIEETVPIIEPDFEAEPKSETEIPSLDNTDIQPATEGADTEPQADADLQKVQPESVEQTASEQDVIVPAPEVGSGDNLIDAPDHRSSTNLIAEDQDVKEPDSSQTEEVSAPPRVLEESSETFKAPGSSFEMEIEPVATVEPEPVEATTGDTPSSPSNKTDVIADERAFVEDEFSSPAEIDQPLGEVLDEVPTDTLDTSAAEQPTEGPKELESYPADVPTIQPSEPQHLDLGGVSEPAVPVENAPTRDTKPSSPNLAAEPAAQVPLDLVPSSDPLPSTPVTSSEPRSPPQLVSEPTEPSQEGRDATETTKETHPLSVKPDTLTDEDTVTSDVQTIPVSTDEVVAEDAIQERLDRPSQPAQPDYIPQSPAAGSPELPTDWPAPQEPVQETASSIPPITDPAPASNYEEEPASSGSLSTATEAKQDTSNDVIVDKVEEESVELPKDKPPTPVTEIQQPSAPHGHFLEDSLSQNDPQATDGRDSEMIQQPKVDEERSGYEAATSEAEVQETLETAQDAFIPKGESPEAATVPDTGALPGPLPNSTTEPTDTPDVNESEKPIHERGENEFTTEDWQSLATKEKKNIKKKLKRKGLDLIIKDSFESTVSGSEAFPEADTELRPAPAQLEEMTTELTETDAQTEKLPGVSASDQLTSSPDEDKPVHDTEEEIRNDEPKQQAEPTRQITVGQEHVSTDVPSSQELLPVAEIKPDQQETPQDDVPSTQDKNEGAVEFDDQHKHEAEGAVEAPIDTEVPLSVEEQPVSELQEGASVPSPAENATSQESGKETTPAELITEIEPEPLVSHELDPQISAPQVMTDVSHAQDPEQLSSAPATEPRDAKADLDIVADPTSRSNEQTPDVQETSVVEQPSTPATEASPKKSKKKKKSRKSDIGESDTPSSETNNAIGRDVQQETSRSVEDTQQHEIEDKTQNIVDSSITSPPADEIPPSTEQRPAESERSGLDILPEPSQMREAETDLPSVADAELSRGTSETNEGQGRSPFTEELGAQNPIDVSPASKKSESTESTRSQSDKSAIEGESTPYTTGKGGEDIQVPELDVHAGEEPLEVEQTANIMPAEDKKKKKKKKGKKNLDTAETESAEPSNDHASLEQVQTSGELQDGLKHTDVGMINLSTQPVDSVRNDEPRSPREVSSEKPALGLPTSTPQKETMPKTTFDDMVKQKPDDAKSIESPAEPRKNKSTTHQEGIASSIFSMASSFFSQKDKKKRKGEPTESPGTGPASPAEPVHESQQKPLQARKNEARSTPKNVVVEPAQQIEEDTTVEPSEPQRQLEQLEEPVAPVEQGSTEDASMDSVKSAVPDANEVPIPIAIGNDSQPEQAVDATTMPEPETRQPVEQQRDTVPDSSEKLSKKDKKKKKKKQKEADDETGTTKEALDITPSDAVTTKQPIESGPDTQQSAEAPEPPSTLLEPSNPPRNLETPMELVSDVFQSVDSPLPTEQTREVRKGLKISEDNIDGAKDRQVIDPVTDGDVKLDDVARQASPAPELFAEPLLAEPVPSATGIGENTTIDADITTPVNAGSLIVEPPQGPSVDEPVTQPRTPDVPTSQAPTSAPSSSQPTPSTPTKAETADSTSDSKMSKKEKKRAKKLALEKELSREPEASRTRDDQTPPASEAIEPETQGGQSLPTQGSTQSAMETTAPEATNQATEDVTEGDTETAAAKSPKGKNTELGTATPVTTVVDDKLEVLPITESMQPTAASVPDNGKAESGTATTVEPTEKAVLPKTTPDALPSGPDASTGTSVTVIPATIPQGSAVILPEKKSRELPLSPQDKRMDTADQSTKPILRPVQSIQKDTVLTTEAGSDDPPATSTKEKKKKRRKGSEQVASPPRPVLDTSPETVADTDKGPAQVPKDVDDTKDNVRGKPPNKPETSSIFARVTAAAAAAWGTKKVNDKTANEQTKGERKEGDKVPTEKNRGQHERSEQASTNTTTKNESDSNDIKSPIMDALKDSRQGTAVPREVQEDKTNRRTEESSRDRKDKEKEQDTTRNAKEEVTTPQKKLKSSRGTRSVGPSGDEPRGNTDESKQSDRQGEKPKPHVSTANGSAKPEKQDKKALRRPQPNTSNDVESPILGRPDSELSRGSPQPLLRRDSGVEEPRGGLLREDYTTFTPILGMESNLSDTQRSPSRLLEPVQEVPEAEAEPGRGALPAPKVRRNSGPVSDASSFQRRSRRLSEEARRDSFSGERSPLRRSKPPRSPEPFRDSGVDTEGWEYPQSTLDRTVMQTPEPKTERRLRRSPRGTPVLREPTVPGPTPEPEKRKQYGVLTPVGAAAGTTVAAGAGAGLASTLSRSGPGPEPSTSRSTPTRSPTPTSRPNSNPAASYAGQRSFSDNASPVRRSTPRLESAGRRAVSNTSLSRRRTPEPLNFRPESPGINRSSGTPTPPLRRADKRMSGDLRAIRQQNNTATAPATATVTAPVSSTPVANEGRARAAKDMADIYDGFGEGRIGSPRSPTRPHSMRRRQSMQVLELENRVEQLMAENRMLSEARASAETSLSQRAASSLADRDAEIDNLKQSLQFLQHEVTRLTEVNDGLTSANAELANKDTGRVADLENRNAVVARELEEARRAKGTSEQSLEEKDAEIADLRAQLDSAKEKIRDLQRQILEAKAHDDHFLNIRDEDHFDHRCQQLCSHVQQWVLRFSKFSDMRACRLTNEINDEKTIDRLDNAVLDGSDVDVYLRDRVKRRDIFMSMTMNMIWEFVFTRYLFGMDREQRQKLKSLEKLLTEVGPPEAVRQWRAVTLTLLSKRESFKRQRDLDTEAVVQAIFQTLCKILPPPTNLEDQIQSQLRRVMREAVGLSIEMRTQKAEYMMLPPLRPEYDADGELTATVQFNASMMNERSGSITTSNEDLEAQGAIVRVVLFPLVVKKGDDNGKGDEEIVVCPAQVLVPRSKLFPGASDGGSTSIGARSHISLVTETMGQTEVDY